MRYKVEKRKERPYYFLYVEGNEDIEVMNYLNKLLLLGLSTKTIRTYCYGLLNLHRWLDAKCLKFSELKQSNLFDYISYQKSNGNSVVSINNRLVICNNYYQYLFGKNLSYGRGSIMPSPYYKTNVLLNEMIPFKKIRYKNIKLKTPRKLIEILSRDEVNKFINSLNTYRDVAIVLLMYLCGLRSIEVIGIKLNNVDFNAGHIKVNGKGNKERLIPLQIKIIDMIRKYISYERNDNDNFFLFVVLKGVNKGNQMTSEGLRSIFRYHRSKTISKANPHRFRHSFGSEMAKEGISIPILQKLMGHESIDVTMQYVHINNIDVMNEYNRIMSNKNEDKNKEK